jgi:transcriptional regulator with XRE-family HTH domain
MAACSQRRGPLRTERDAFGPALKAERDRRGITLQAIADSTKISLSLLAALERNDMSRWPKGIFRRAFIREYVAALGLPPEPLVAEFVRLFPDSPCGATMEVADFRLTLESDPSATWKAVRARALFAGVEISVVLAIGSIAAWLLGGQTWTVCGIIALVYYPVTRVCVERVPKLRLLFQRAGSARWLHAWSRALHQLRVLWPRRGQAMELSGRLSTEELEKETSAPAPEWRTASN